LASSDWLFALSANTVIYFSTGASLLSSAPNNAACAAVNHVSMAQR
jgi:uroporphyrinogen-III synthase